ncbi:unnamed protein product [Camellia sinensis]
MGRGKFKGKPTGRRQFSTPEEMKVEAEENEEERSEEESEEESDEEPEKHKGNQGIIEIENPNLVKPKTLKAKDVDIEKTTELSRREREEIEKQKAHERYMRMQEQGKTEQARKDLANGDKAACILLSPHLALARASCIGFEEKSDWLLYDSKGQRLPKKETKKKLPKNKRRLKLANNHDGCKEICVKTPYA